MEKYLLDLLPRCVKFLCVQYNKVIFKRESNPETEREAEREKLPIWLA